MQIQDLLAKDIVQVSWSLFENGHYRESMINAILCLFDMIREESGLQDDGASLIGKAFSVENPRIVLADLQSESGKNIQKGIIQILQGYFQAYRNVGSHSLKVSIDEKEVLSVLIGASRLYEKILEAEKAIFLRHDGVYLHSSDDTDQYIRFYEDNCVITVTTAPGGNHREIFNWFNRENAEDFRHFSLGTYEVSERTIDFHTESSAGRVNYTAIIRPNTLHVKSESLINGHTSEAEYEFLSWDRAKS